MTKNLTKSVPHVRARGWNGIESCANVREQSIDKKIRISLGGVDSDR